MLLSAVAFFAVAPQVVPDLPHGPQSVDYEVRATTLESDADGNVPLDVRAIYHHPLGTNSLFAIPHWTPGSYRLRDFPDRITDVRVQAIDADGNTTPLDVVATHRGRWSVEHATGLDAVQVDYRVILNDDDRFMAPNDERVSLTYEGPHVYLFRRGMLDAPCRVRFALPDGWEAASGLLASGDGSFFAADYDFLADCPVKLGKLRRWTYETAGVPIDVVVDLPPDLEFDADTWVDNIRRITDVQAAMFGGLPFERYTFLFCASRSGKGGGLEHLTSTAIGVRTPSLLRSSRTSLGTIAHEFFHLWNVKRMRPAALGPFDYGKPNRTTMLWLCEGVTSYYTSVTQARAGLLGEDAFWRSMQSQLMRFENTPGRTVTSSSDASWQVWDPTPPERSVNYYNSGQVLGLLLDLQIRDLTDNRRSLDDLMRALWRQCETTGRGYADEDVEHHLLALTGHDFTPWFDAHVRGTRSPDYRAILAAAGIDAALEIREQAALPGLTTVRTEGGREVWWAAPGSDAAAALRGGAGRVLAIEDTAIDDADAIGAAIGDRRAGERVTLRLLGPTGREFTRAVTLEPRRMAQLSFEPRDDAGERAMAIRQGITRGIPARPGAR